MMTCDTDTLVERIGSGMTSARDADLVHWMVNRLARLESAMAHIAVYGTGEAAMIAARAVAGDPTEHRKAA